MVKAIVTISEQANRVINVVKAEYGLKDKSQAIEKMAEEYEALIFEPRIKPSFIRRLKKLEKSKKIKIGTLADFKKMYSIK
jgi:hypothetical protein